MRLVGLLILQFCNFMVTGISNFLPHRINWPIHRKKFTVGFIHPIFGSANKTQNYETEKTTDRFRNSSVYFMMFRFLHDLLAEPVFSRKKRSSFS